MVTIRLSRTGRKKAPSFRFVISEKGRDTLGRSLEILGHYHPLSKDDKEKIVLNKERIEYWLSKGAQTSSTVHNLLVDAGIIKGDKKRTIGKRKSKKQLEAEKAEAEAKEKESKAEAPAEEKVEEKPVEEQAETPSDSREEEKKEDAKEESKEPVEAQVETSTASGEAKA